MPSRIQRLDNLAYIRQKKLKKEPAGDAGDAGAHRIVDTAGDTTMQEQTEGKMYILYYLKLVILIL